MAERFVPKIKKRKGGTPPAAAVEPSSTATDAGDKLMTDPANWDSKKEIKKSVNMPVTTRKAVPCATPIITPETWLAGAVPGDAPSVDGVIREDVGQTVSAWDTEPRARDRQVGGDHYQQTKLQPWDVVEAFDLDFFEGSAVKYLLRYKRKGGVEDLKKARHYIDRLIEQWDEGLRTMEEEK